MVKFYNKRRTAEQWIKEGKYALNRTRLWRHDFVDNQECFEAGCDSYPAKPIDRKKLFEMLEEYLLHNTLLENPSL